MSFWRMGLSVLVVGALGLGSCSGSSSKALTGGHSISVFSLRVGECIVPPTAIKAEISSVTVVPCRAPHPEEVYAFVPDGTKDTPYPGDASLRTFADGNCLQRYAAYVGVDYRDSSLYYTYLLPSVRSWNSDDRSVVCIVTTTGQQLTASVKGSRR